MKRSLRLIASDLGVESTERGPISVPYIVSTTRRGGGKYEAALRRTVEPVFQGWGSRDTALVEQEILLHQFLIEDVIEQD
jgi:hypothetical protein